MVDPEKKLDFLHQELLSLKQTLREGTKISDDARKAIMHDLTQLDKEYKNKRLIAWGTVLTIVIGSLSFFGFKSIQKTVAEEIAQSELHKKILNELKEDKIKVANELKNAQKLSTDLIAKEKELDIKFQKMLATLHTQEAKAHKLMKMLLNTEKGSLNLDTLIDTTFIEQAQKSPSFNFIRALGLSEKSLIKTIAINVNSFNPTVISMESFSEAVKSLQSRFDLEPDGEMGPCSSLMLGSLFLEEFPNEAENELSKSSFKLYPWLVNSFQACNKGDKNNIGRYLDYTDLPLHKQLNNFIQLASIDSEQLRQKLRTYKVSKEGYKAIEYIGYQP
ncbi:MAG: hypothetical protein ACPGUG_15970 [Pseudoalteromonas marina]